MNELIESNVLDIEKAIKENVIMIDIRRADEWEYTGIIQTSLKMTFFDEYGNHNLERWMKEFKKHVTSQEQDFILICAHGNRTRLVGNYLIEQGYKNTAHLSHGIDEWLREGKETMK